MRVDAHRAIAGVVVLVVGLEWIGALAELWCWGFGRCQPVLGVVAPCPGVVAGGASADVAKRIDHAGAAADGVVEIGGLIAGAVFGNCWSCRARKQAVLIVGVGWRVVGEGGRVVARRNHRRDASRVAGVVE